MLNWLAGWLVAQPAHILLVAAMHGALWVLGCVVLPRDAPRANVLWVPAILWFAYAGWEWLVVTRSPDANIRVDLLLVWPPLGLATVWALWRAVRGARAAARARR